MLRSPMVLAFYAFSFGFNVTAMLTPFFPGKLEFAVGFCTASFVLLATDVVDTYFATRQRKGK